MSEKIKKDIVRAVVEIEVPHQKWISELSREFPDLKINILSMYLIRNNYGNILINLRGNNLSLILKRLKSHESVIEYNLISETSNSLLLNVKIRNPWLLMSTIENEVVFKFPISIINGWSEWELYADRGKLYSLFKNLESLGINLKLKSIGKHEKKPILTSRQNEILTIAMNEGYYQVPREITLDDLAKKVQVAPSTLSEMIRKINKKLVNLI
ncbi:MAG: hypothetical protein GF329_10340 [Candidatus Lokiarchaeota archaeon]|nr:hypothetical protein [Candidatus Lokiarchaeota archaeon]